MWSDDGDGDCTTRTLKLIDNFGRYSKSIFGTWAIYHLSLEVVGFFAAFTHGGGYATNCNVTNFRT